MKIQDSKTSDALDNPGINGELEDLNEQIKSMMTKSKIILAMVKEAASVERKAQPKVCQDI